MKKRWVPYLAISLMVVLIGIAFIPTIVSTNIAKDQVMKMINRRLPGQLHIDQWSLGWLSGIQCDGIMYQDVPANLSVRVDRIAVSKGLLSLALNYRKPGVIEIVRPQGTVTLPAEDPSPGESTDNPPPLEATHPAENTPSDGTKNRSSEKPGTFSLPLIAAEIHVSEGILRVIFPDNNKDVIAKDMMFQLNISDPVKPVTYQLTAHAGEGNGQISGQGSIFIRSKGSADSDQIQSNADITIKNWSLAPLLAIGAAIADTPSGKGIINGQFQIEGDPERGLHLTGQLAGTDIRLAGGQLGSDTPSVKKITCDIDALQTGSRWTINRLDVNSVPVRGTVSGYQDTRGDNRFQTEAVFNLAEISAQLPATLNLKSGTRITRGQIEITATAESTAHTTRFDGRLHLDRLAGVSGKKKLALNKPLDATVVGSYGVNGIHLDTFSLQSAFLSGKGQGDLDDLQVELRADLKAALKEAGKFIDTQGWRAAGKVDMALHAGSRSGGARHFIEANLSSDSLQLQRKGKVVVPKDRFQVSLNTDFQLDKKFRLKALLNPSVDFDGWFGKGQWAVDELSLDSTGGLAEIKHLTTSGTYRLKPLSALMHVFGSLPPHTALSGKAVITAAGDFDGKTLALKKARIETTEFSYKRKGKRLKYQKVMVTTQGTIRPADRSVALKSVEINAGKEHIRLSPVKIQDWSKAIAAIDTTLDASVDLGKIKPILSDLVDLPWLPSKQVKLVLAVTKSSGASGKVSGRVKSSDFSIGGRADSSKKHPLNIDYKVNYTTSPKGEIQALADTVVDYQAWMGKGRIAVKQIEWPGSDAAQPRVHQLTYDGSLALKPLSQMMHAMAVFPSDMDLDGQADIRTRLSSDSKKITFEKSIVTINRFGFRQGKRRFKDKRIVLHTQGQVNLKSRSARLTPLEVTAAAGKVAFPNLLIDDWADLIHGVKGNGTARFDLASLSQLVGGVLDLPEKTRVSGRMEIEINSDLTSVKNQALNLSCVFAPIKIDSDQEILIDEDQINIKVELKGDLARNDMIIQQMAVVSKPLSMTATGRIFPQGKERRLTARGDMAVDLKKLQNPINALLGTDLELSGKSERPFSFDFKTKNGEWQALSKQAALAVALHAEQINGFGLALKSVDVPVKIEKSFAKSDIRAEANGGKLALTPTIDLTATTPVLSLPDHSVVLSQARITKEMANELLALIHPIFKGTAAVQGSLDLVMHHFSWPLPEASRNQANFSGILKFKDVRLNAEGLIYDLLTVMKVKERDTEIGNRTIEFSCKNGRIQCSSLRMKVKDYRLELSGSMGFDGTLDYVARIPVTPELVGKKVYAYLQDAYLDIPIGGTISKPALNMASFQSTLKKLVSGVAGKLLEQNAGKLFKKLFN